MVVEVLVDGVNRPLSFLVRTRELDALLTQVLLNPGTDVDQRPGPSLVVAQFLQRNQDLTRLQ